MRRAALTPGSSTAQPDDLLWGRPANLALAYLAGLAFLPEGVVEACCCGGSMAGPALGMLVIPLQRPNWPVCDTNTNQSKSTLASAQLFV
jgi:hypothetical protein